MSTIHDSKVDDWLRRWLPGRCAFCLGGCEPTAGWCRACHLALPWNRVACPLCAEPQPDWATPRRCGRCLKRPPSFDEARVALRYEGELRGLMRRFKFQASPRAGRLLAALLEESLREVSRPQALLAVPLHPQRARQRGFDQSSWLAERLSRRLGIPLVTAQRHRDTPSQRGLNRQQRRSNLRAAFQIESTLPPEVALLDDVMTTGATFEALARACRQAGAERVVVWAVARTPLP